jgi:SAM-dependent methyltransferase
VPEPAELANCYRTAYYGGFIKRYWKDYRKGVRLGAELKKIKTRGRYLDVGCALGTMAAGVRDSSGWEVFGTEFSPETARAGFELSRVEIKACPSPGQAGFEPGSFDYIYANNVIEHLPDPAQFLGEARALLITGGLLRLVTPNGETDISPNTLLWEKKGAVLGTRHEGHIWFFSERALRLLCAGAGFETASFCGFHFLDALKSRGLWPGALARFEKLRSRACGPQRHEESPRERLTIPPETGRLADALTAGWRGLFRLPGLTFGGDFDVLLRSGGGG